MRPVSLPSGWPLGSGRRGPLWGGVFLFILYAEQGPATGVGDRGLPWGGGCSVVGSGGRQPGPCGPPRA